MALAVGEWLELSHKSPVSSVLPPAVAHLRRSACQTSSHPKEQSSSWENWIQNSVSVLADFNSQQPLGTVAVPVMNSLSSSYLPWGLGHWTRAKKLELADKSHKQESCLLGTFLCLKRGHRGSSLTPHYKHIFPFNSFGYLLCTFWFVRENMNKYPLSINFGF